MEQKNDNMSFKSLMCHIRDTTRVRDDVWADVRGVVASAKMSADSLAYLRTKRAECNEHICEDCIVVGLIWKLIDCDSSRIDEFYSKCDMFIRDHSEEEDLKIIAREGFIFYRWHMMSLLLEKEIENLESASHKEMSLGGKYNEAQLSRIFWGLKANGYLTSSYGTAAFVNMGMNKKAEGGLQWIMKNNKNKGVSKSALYSLLIELGFESQTLATKIADEHFHINLHRSTKPSKEHEAKIKEIISKAAQ